MPDLPQGRRAAPAGRVSGRQCVGRSLGGASICALSRWQKPPVRFETLSVALVVGVVLGGFTLAPAQADVADGAASTARPSLPESSPQTGERAETQTGPASEDRESAGKQGKGGKEKKKKGGKKKKKKKKKKKGGKKKKGKNKKSKKMKPAKVTVSGAPCGAPGRIYVEVKSKWPPIAVSYQLDGHEEVTTVVENKQPPREITSAPIRSGTDVVLSLRRTDQALTQKVTVPVDCDVTVRVKKLKRDGKADVELIRGEPTGPEKGERSAAGEGSAPTDP